MALHEKWGSRLRGNDVIYRGEVLRSDQQGIGARLLHNDSTEFDIGFAASLPAHSSHVGARAGMPDLGTLIASSASPATRPMPAPRTAPAR